MLCRMTVTYCLIVIFLIFFPINVKAYENIQQGQTQELNSVSQQFYHVNISNYISLDIYIPNELSESKQGLSTMYVMDGQHYFYNAVAYQRTLRNRVHISPSFIVVGINTEKLENMYGGRRELMGSHADKLITLLEKDIIPYVDNHFNTNKTRMYFGWQFAAGFGLELLTKNPELIEGYFLASSPTFTEKRLSAVEKLLSSKQVLDNYIYLTLGESETHAVAEHQRLISALKENNMVNWHYNLSSTHNHQTTPLDSFTTGLSWYFNDYPDLTFYSIKDIVAFGGISAVQEYFQQRGERYHISTEVGQQAKFSMFRHAVQENNWKIFQELEQALGGYKLDNDASEGWYRLFGNFCLKNQDFIGAIKYLSQGVNAYPDSSELKKMLLQAQQHHN